MSQGRDLRRRARRRERSPTLEADLDIIVSASSLAHARIEGSEDPTKGLKRLQKASDLKVV